MTNVFLGKAASAGGGGSQSGTLVPGFAVDGTDATFGWQNPVAGSTYWQVDVGSAVILSWLRLYQAVVIAYGDSVILEGANAAAGPYTAIQTLTPGYAGNHWAQITQLTPYRYYRIRPQSYAGTQWFVREIEGHDSLPVQDSFDLFAYKSATSGGPGSDSHPPSEAVNSNRGSGDGWMRVGAAEGTYIEIDAGSPVSVGRIELTHRDTSLASWWAVFEGANSATGPYTPTRDVTHQPSGASQPPPATISDPILSPTPYRYYRLRLVALNPAAGNTWWLTEIAAYTETVERTVTSNRGLAAGIRGQGFFGLAGMVDPAAYVDEYDAFVQLGRRDELVSYIPANTAIFAGLEGEWPYDLIYDGAGREWRPEVLRNGPSNATSSRYFTYWHPWARRLERRLHTGAASGTSRLLSVCQGPSGPDSVWLLFQGSDPPGGEPNPDKFIAYWDGAASQADRTTYNVYNGVPGGNMIYHPPTTNFYSLFPGDQNPLTMGFDNSVPNARYVGRSLFKVGSQIYLMCEVYWRNSPTVPNYNVQFVALLVGATAEWTGYETFEGWSVAGVFYYVTDLAPYLDPPDNFSGMDGVSGHRVLQFGSETIIAVNKYSHPTYTHNPDPTAPIPSPNLDWVYTFDGASLSPIHSLQWNGTDEAAALSGGVYYHPETDTFWVYEYALDPATNRHFVRLWKAPAATPASLTEQPRYEVVLPNTATNTYTDGYAYPGLVTSDEVSLFIYAGLVGGSGIPAGYGPHRYLRYVIGSNTWTEHDGPNISTALTGTVARKVPGVI